MHNSLTNPATLDRVEARAKIRKEQLASPPAEPSESRGQKRAREATERNERYGIAPRESRTERAVPPQTRAQRREEIARGIQNLPVAEQEIEVILPDVSAPVKKPHKGLFQKG